jgi:hypothetical protein
MYFNATQLKAKQNPNLSYWIEAYKRYLPDDGIIGIRKKR